MRSLLVYGPDQGLLRERAELLVRTEAEDLQDPFRIVELSGNDLKEDPARLADEANTFALTGGGKVIRIRDVTESLTNVFKEFLGRGKSNALLIVEAGNLKPRSALRKVFEESENAAAVPCYADEGADLGKIINETFEKHGISVSPDAFSGLLELLGSDRLVTRSELEKLVLYIGPSKNVTIADVQACIGDSAATSLDNVVKAVFSGNQEALDKELSRVFLEGMPPISMLRAAARHMQRLHLAISLVAKGYTKSQAMKALRPPVFYKNEDSFKNHMRLWNSKKISKALTLITKAELDCKTTGMPEQAVCGRTLMRVAQASRHP